MNEYIRGYPNHLIYEGLDCCIQRFSTEQQIVSRLVEDAKTQMKSMGIMSNSDENNVFQRRLEERKAKLGREGVVALREIPWLRDDPDNVKETAQPFNLNLMSQSANTRMKVTESKKKRQDSRRRKDTRRKRKNSQIPQRRKERHDETGCAAPN